MRDRNIEEMESIYQKMEDNENRLAHLENAFGDLSTALGSNKSNGNLVKRERTNQISARGHRSNGNEP